MINDEYVDKLFKFDIVVLPVEEFIIFNNVVDEEFKYQWILFNEMINAKL